MVFSCILGLKCAKMNSVCVHATFGPFLGVFVDENQTAVTVEISTFVGVFVKSFKN